MLYVSLEFTTLATAFLVTFYWKRESLEAGYKYLVLVTVGVLFGLVGLLLIYCAAAGLPQMAGKRILLLTELGSTAKLMSPSVVLLANALLVAGFGTKAGLVPFHAWLPDAHAEAPEPISALLSGVVIKVGAYALARTIAVFASTYPAIPAFMAVICSLTMLVGIVMAWAQDDLKRLLAFHSVSQMGYIAEGMGMGTYLGIYAGLFHLLNHTVFKGLLFLAVGAVMYSTGGLRRMKNLGGIASKMPVTALCFFVGALAMGGMPPFNGFFSKFTLFIAVADRGLVWAAIIGMITSLLTLACMVHTAYKTFWGPLRAEGGNPTADLKEVPPTMQLAMLALAALALAIGLFPRLTYPLLDNATRCILKIVAG
jgi:formate hydrogenlyase subunit 3/multisubunit Na+/H+ antiporter MnhD subunit